MERYLNTFFWKSAPKFKSSLEENPTKLHNTWRLSWLCKLFGDIYKDDATNEKNYVSLEKLKGRCKNLSEIAESRENDFNMEFCFLEKLLGNIKSFKNENGEMIREKLKILLRVSEYNLKSIEYQTCDLKDIFEEIEDTIEEELKIIIDTYNATNGKIQEHVEKIGASYESRQKNIHLKLENLVETCKTKEAFSQELLVTLTYKNDATEERILTCASRITRLLEKFEQNWRNVTQL